jgi:hypothetical protein
MTLGLVALVAVLAADSGLLWMAVGIVGLPLVGLAVVASAALGVVGFGPPSDDPIVADPTAAWMTFSNRIGFAPGVWQQAGVTQQRRPESPGGTRKRGKYAFTGRG